MNKLLFSLLFICILFSCGEQQKKITVPPDILPKEKMAQVIADIHIAEAEINLNTPPPLPGEPGDSLSKKRIRFENIFEKNQITKSQYDISIVFYIAHPELLDTV